MTEPVPFDFPRDLTKRTEPTVGVWNRLEGRPRTTDFDRALRAEIRDPLWLLTRQWQLGEFQASDGGSPVTASYTVQAASVSRFKPFDGNPVELPPEQPLPVEALAERRALRFTSGTERVSFDLRLAIGRRWFKLLATLPLGLGELLASFRAQYVKKYPIALPDPLQDKDSPRLAHPEVWASMQAMAGRYLDGYQLYDHIKYRGGTAYDGIEELLGLTLHKQAIIRLGLELRDWFDTLIQQPANIQPELKPTGEDAWDGRHLEHNFSVGTTLPGGAQKTLTAREYPGGTLDWHAFSVDANLPLGGTRPPKPFHRTVFPAPVRYAGMPLPRWWAVEDGRTNFAAVTPDSTDLARLIFLEFALVYGNDWYQLPCDLPAGSLATLENVTITDTFGIPTVVEPANAGPDQDWRRWSMFSLDNLGADPVAADTSLLLPASVPKIAEGPALEEVVLLRDENANLVWGVEQTVRTATGEPRRGSEIAAESVAWRQRHQPAQPPGPPLAPVSYEVMNTVPEHWIPFVPVHQDNTRRSIHLQRAALPSAIRPADPAQPRAVVRPRTDLLREGLDRGEPYFVNEEEVTQTGTRLTLSFQRTRWRDGRVVVWLGVRRGTGRGQGSSGLRFDSVIDTP
ncbi:hypothetical protein [Crossiella sp. CA198]|uniref:hypothetical protein n=1 Tax=Crossiella sp. CA198 TaxID=3455607 RepID=UPI003F8D5074